MSCRPMERSLYSRHLLLAVTQKLERWPLESGAHEAPETYPSTL